MKKHSKLLIIIFVILIILIVLITKKEDIIRQISRVDILQQNEEELVSMKIKVVEEKEDKYICLITFVANDENNKIKQIQMPTENEGEIPQIIYINEKEGISEIAVDYEFKKDDLDKKIEVDIYSGESITFSTIYTLTYKDDDGNDLLKETFLKGATVKVASNILEKENYYFVGWSSNKEELKTEYFENWEYKGKPEDTTFYPVWEKEKNENSIQEINNESLIGEVSKVNENQLKTIEVNGEIYNTNIIVINNNLVLDGETQINGATLSNKVYEFGDKTIDVATASQYAQNMVVLKVNGNLVIESGVTLTACKSESGYGGPKGLLIYCTGTIINRGTIDMTARGAKAEGQNVYMWENEDESYEYVPATGATGGNRISIPFLTTRTVNGNKGNNGNNRKTGGGGTGAGRNWRGGITVSAGGTGTSYSGGAGSGASNSDGDSGGYATSGAGSSVGGAGGNGAVRSGNSSGYGQVSMGGTGNSSGGYATYRIYPVNYVKREGTGGLLIIYADKLLNSTNIKSNGVSSSTANRSNSNGRIDTGGASGGGSINIFYNSYFVSQDTGIDANGGIALYGEGGNAGGAGGNGSISIGTILTGTYESVYKNY